MLNDLGPSLSDGQANDLWKRLENSDATAALAAEIELGILWALAQITEVNFHPNLHTNKRPEAYCPNLFRSGAAYIEVTAISDDSFSDKDKMERAANIICQFANTIRSGAGSNLYFHFAEQSGYETGQYRRRRRITSAFRLTPSMESKLRIWIENPKWPDPQKIRLTDDQIDAVIQWRDIVHPADRTFSTMPAIAYDLEDNPVFKRLAKKRSQLSGVPAGALKCIFLGDAGCNILRNLNPTNPGNYVVTGERIIQHFLDKSSIDLVVVFSAQSRNISNPIGSPRIWRITIFDKRNAQPTTEYQLLDALTEKFPRPMYEAYQARALHRQGRFSPQGRGQYLGTYMHVEDIKSMKTEIKFSARLFQEFIAGRIGADHFRRLNGALELFESELKQGRTLKSARLEPAGLEEDDDYLVFEFASDAAARPLQNPRAGQLKT
jgi:hypothetical protein